MRLLLRVQRGGSTSTYSAKTQQKKAFHFSHNSRKAEPNTKRDGPRMTNDKETKKTKTAIDDEETQLSPSEQPSDRMENPRHDTNPMIRLPNVDRRMLPSSLYSDPATEKLGSISLMDMPLLARTLQASTPLFPPAVRRRVSREEFRQRLIATIDEALRIIDDDVDFEGIGPRGN